MQRKLIIGTRGSPLALYQANLVQSLLSFETDIKILKTSGDTIKGDLKEFGGKGLFTKELEEALMDGRIDLAVHSMKDVPTVGQDSLMIGAVLEREDPRDAFISHKVERLADLPEGAVVGSASIRRRAQLSAMRPDVKFTLLRGNVGTRLGKLINGECDATFLACAGLKRLGQDEVITEAIETDVMLPAPAQGAIGIEIRKDDDFAQDAIAPLNHGDTDLAITVERAFLRALDGSCRTPIAALAEIMDGGLNFRGEVIAKDGSIRFSRTERLDLPSKEKAREMGLRLGQDIREEAGERIIWDE
ncbi:hydroxymethylbilane synthase [Hellea sp.]|nr:hydroxymethylbilane synthase [Hellea sp.]